MGATGPTGPGAGQATQEVDDLGLHAGIPV
jgi:hypothetical protein